jgi:entericidin B
MVSPDGCAIDRGIRRPAGKKSLNVAPKRQNPWNRQAARNLTQSVQHGATAMTRLTPAAILAFLLLSLAACNTIAGAGQDIEAGGQAITNTAEDVQEEL